MLKEQMILTVTESKFGDGSFDVYLARANFVLLAYNTVKPVDFSHIDKVFTDHMRIITQVNALPFEDLPMYLDGDCKGKIQSYWLQSPWIEKTKDFIKGLILERLEG